MKQIKDIATTDLVNSQTSRELVSEYKTISKPKADDKVINRVFANLLVYYGHKWASLYPDDELYDEAKRKWALELGEFDLMQIKYALDIVVDNFPDWPPGVGEFKQLCRLSKKEPMYKPPQLTNPSKPETVKKSIAEMMRVLK